MFRLCRAWHVVWVARRLFCRFFWAILFCTYNLGCPTPPSKLGPLCTQYNMTGSLRNGSLEFRKLDRMGPYKQTGSNAQQLAVKKTYSILFQSHVSTRWVGKSCQIITKKKLSTKWSGPTPQNCICLQNDSL